MARGRLERLTAARALEARCPRCGSQREPRQRYCLECGLALPAVTGTRAALRRGWIRRLGWYPGDAVWASLALAALAAAGSALAIVRPHTHGAREVIVAPTLGAAPAAATGRWPAGQGGWTIVLSSLPAQSGARAAQAVAKRAAADGLPQVGVLDSSRYASLIPGYFVVYSGVYGAAGDAQTALASVRARGYAGAYPSRITP
jgi:hypothetical protein